MGMPPVVLGTHLPPACASLRSLPHMPQFFGSICSFDGSTSSMWPLQSLSRPSQISTPPLVGPHGPPVPIMSGPSCPPPSPASPPVGVMSSGVMTPLPESLQLRQYGFDLQPAAVATSTRPRSNFFIYAPPPCGGVATATPPRRR